MTSSQGSEVVRMKETLSRTGSCSVILGVGTWPWLLRLHSCRKHKIQDKVLWQTFPPLSLVTVKGSFHRDRMYHSAHRVTWLWQHTNRENTGSHVHACLISWLSTRCLIQKVLCSLHLKPLQLFHYYTGAQAVSTQLQFIKSVS